MLRYGQWIVNEQDRKVAEESISMDSTYTFAVPQEGTCTGSDIASVVDTDGKKTEVGGKRSSQDESTEPMPKKSRDVNPASQVDDEEHWRFEVKTY